MQSISRPTAAARNAQELAPLVFLIPLVIAGIGILMHMFSH